MALLDLAVEALPHVSSLLPPHPQGVEATTGATSSYLRQVPTTPHASIRQGVADGGDDVPGGGLRGSVALLPRPRVGLRPRPPEAESQ